MNLPEFGKYTEKTLDYADKCGMIYDIIIKKG